MADAKPNRDQGRDAADRAAMTSTDASAMLCSMTGRPDLNDALEWIAEGRNLRSVVPHHELLSALVKVSGVGNAAGALRRAIDVGLRSDVDPSTELFGVHGLVAPGEHRRVLMMLARYSPDKTLATLTPDAVAYVLGQGEDVFSTLCLVAGISWRDLRDRARPDSVSALPTDPDNRWTQEQVVAAFDVINQIVEGTSSPSLPGADAARPVEFVLPSRRTGWNEVWTLMVEGVPYETLLAQRAVGGAWLSHRQTTARLLGNAVAAMVWDRLADRGLRVIRPQSHGGTAPPAEIRRLVGNVGNGQVAAVVPGSASTSGIPTGIVQSIARDGGTSRKSAGRLTLLPQRATGNLVLLLVGPGWSGRGETAELVKAYGGNVFTDASLDALSEHLIASHGRNKSADN
jgi:hypothetical protein